jgi:hypothetical protein
LRNLTMKRPHLLIPASLCLSLLLCSPIERMTAQGKGLKIVVVEGEDAVNIIQQRTAVSPIVEVRDDNDLPVAGALGVSPSNRSDSHDAFSCALTRAVIVGHGDGRGCVPEVPEPDRHLQAPPLRGRGDTA